MLSNHIISYLICLILCPFLSGNEHKSKLVKEFKAFLKTSPMIVVRAYCNHDEENDALKLSLESMTPSVALFKFPRKKLKPDEDDFQCENNHMLYWKGEHISNFPLEDEADTEGIMDWVANHIDTGEGHVLHIDDHDNEIVQKIKKKISVYATVDHRCESKLKRHLERFRGVAKLIEEQDQDIVMFQYKSKTLFKKKPKPICYALPVYMYVGKKEIGVEKFFEKNMEQKLPEWIKNKASRVKRKGRKSDKPTPELKHSTAAPKEPKIPEPDEAKAKEPKPLVSKMESNGIQEISKEDEFNNAIALEDTVVAFLFHQCKNSSKFGRVYPHISEDLKKDNIPVNLVKVSALKNIFLLYKYAFGDFPILHFYKNGKLFSKLTGATEKDKVMKWINEKRKATKPDDRASKMKKEVHVNDDLLVLQDDTFERAITDNKILVVGFVPMTIYKDFAPKLRRLGKEFKENNFPAKIATKDDNFLTHFNEKENHYPLIVVYKDGKGIAHLPKEEEYILIHDFVKSTLKDVKLITMASGNSTLPYKNIPNDEVVTLNNIEEYNKEKAKSPIILLTRYPETYNEVFFPVYKEIAREIRTQVGLEKIKVLQFQDPEISENEKPYIEMDLIKNGKGIEHTKFDFSSQNRERDKQQIIQWITNSLKQHH